MANGTKAIDALAAYFSGPKVAQHSMGLGMAGQVKAAADEFYALRSALGVSGYVTADEARRAIWFTITSEATP